MIGNRNVLQFVGARRAPLVLQTEAAECGLACLAMVAGAHGYEIDLAQLRRTFPVSARGTTLAHLTQLAHYLKLSTRALKVELNQLGKLQLPAILHWDFNHFVVLTKVGPRQIVVHDPGHGVRELSLDEASRHFTGVALELAPTPQFKPADAREKVRLRQLIGNIIGLKRALVQIILLALGLEVFAVISPFYMQLVVDHALVAADGDLLVVLGLGFLMLALIQVVVTYLRSWVMLVMSTRLNLQLVGNLFHHMLRLPVSFFEKRHLADVVQRFDSLNSIQRTLSNSFIEAMIDGLMTVIMFGLMFIYSWKLVLIVATAAVLYAALRWSLYLPLRQASEEQIVRGAKQQSNLLETVRGVQSVKLFCREDLREGVYRNLMIDNFNAGIRVQKLGMAFRACNALLFGVENVLVIWVGATLVLDGGFSIGMLFAFIAYKQQFTSRIGALIEKGIELKMLGLHAQRVADIALHEPEAQSVPGLVHARALQSSVELRNVSFRYSEAEPYVVRNVNLKIEAGESVALVGPSGCGKTTLLKIILGLLTPSEGEVLVGGEPLTRAGAERYRKIIGTVMQEDQLFAGSIADNIAFFDSEPDEAHMHNCARLAAIADDIEAMPMQYNTLIGDMGTVLSGGQKQRILFARALYKNPKILVLDEATSHLDVARERLVNEATRHLNLTRIIVAHRPETIASAGRVVVLHNGSIQENALRMSALNAA